TTSPRRSAATSSIPTVGVARGTNRTPSPLRRTQRSSPGTSSTATTTWARRAVREQPAGELPVPHVRGERHDPAGQPGHRLGAGDGRDLREEAGRRPAVGRDEIAEARREVPEDVDREPVELGALGPGDAPERPADRHPLDREQPRGEATQDPDQPEARGPRHAAEERRRAIEPRAVVGMRVPARRRDRRAACGRRRAGAADAARAAHTREPTTTPPRSPARAPVTRAGAGGTRRRPREGRRGRAARPRRPDRSGRPDGGARAPPPRGSRGRRTGRARPASLSAARRSGPHPAPARGRYSFGISPQKT